MRGVRLGGTIGSMEVAHADPRAIAATVEEPAYWVYFWTETGAAEKFRVTRAGSVHEVLSWAELKSQGRTFGLYIEAGKAIEDRHLIRLSGQEPNRRRS
ncbi:hypothetical protein D0Z08_00400 [Nocardioides immobilis]|uniref:Uncharacterized protein n=1 Tax=Nocardioides immobilis TaxID=2049295 RepID=A0A417Y9C5_9ACTN|nr:hypothetical protein D0Z08_00400 [Nocardioides immobilis]